ncbi:MAG: cupin [Rhodococcus sp. (in: high G+C Gram-positive bacteria)]|uniref:cupin n=1 Tax=Rhodococcus sp. TaxID=1831 RepID=UPI003D9B51C1
MTTTNGKDGKLTVIEGLATLNPQTGDTPRIEKLASGTGATVIRISFTAGQTMADHQAMFPIVVQTVVGDISFGTEEQTVSLVPGTAVHVDAGIVHRIYANIDSVVMLTILR